MDYIEQMREAERLIDSLQKQLAEAKADKRRLIDIVLRLDAKYDGAMTNKEKTLVKIIGEEFEESDGKP